MRKIKQIAMCTNGDHNQKLFLCDDGTVWLRETGFKWQRLPAIPQDEEEERKERVASDVKVGQTKRADYAAGAMLFAGYLTAMKKAYMVGAKHDAARMVEEWERFCEQNNLPVDLPDGWEKIDSFPDVPRDEEPPPPTDRLERALGFTCLCGKYEKFQPYVFAHWEAPLMVRCEECGRKHTLIRGKVTEKEVEK